ncbi:hypothetical protein IE53DRAFT_226475 [Violaceomyces palustris]|uniref:Uncharacterized protein n=1 Tax=Violaceomyces palustris TaxID=1673888 RepID=A0ACD0P4Q7_9BASI|nr:hypothetical protein IE53DRAFT_226475 [Violaceomyces palustris]
MFQRAKRNLSFVASPPPHTPLQLSPYGPSMSNASAGEGLQLEDATTPDVEIDYLTGHIKPNPDPRPHATQRGGRGRKKGGGDRDPSPSKEVPLWDPNHHRSTIRKLQRNLLAGEKGADAIQDLLASYRQLAQRSALRQGEWDVYLSLSLRHAALDAGVEDGRQRLSRILTIHDESTRSSQLIGLFRRYVDLCSRLFQIHHAVKIRGTEEEEDGVEEGERGVKQGSSSESGLDVVKDWTGLDGGPLLDPLTDLYHPSSISDLAASLGLGDGSEAWRDLIGPEATRERIREAYSRCARNSSGAHGVWEYLLDFETYYLTVTDRSQERIEALKQVYLARLRIPHKEQEATFQRFSRFVSSHFPPDEYEGLMTSANKSHTFSKSVWDAREAWEGSLPSTSKFDLAANPRADLDLYGSYWKPYLLWQSDRVRYLQKGKDKQLAEAELDMGAALYERAVSLFGTYPPSKREGELAESQPPSPEWEESNRKTIRGMTRIQKDSQRVEASQRHEERRTIAVGLWADYLTLLNGPRPDVSLLIEVGQRAIAAIPDSGSLRATLMRLSSRFSRPKSSIEELFGEAVSSGMLSSKVDDLVQLLLARTDCERDFAAKEIALREGTDISEVDPAADMDKFMDVYALQSLALGIAAELDPSQRDPLLRLEKSAIDWIERAVNHFGGPNSETAAALNPLAEKILDSLLKAQGNNPRTWIEITSYWIRRGDNKKARSLFKGAVGKKGMRTGSVASGGADEGYETLLESWIQFEHQRGGLEDVDYAIGRVRAERERLWREWYESYAAAQQDQEQLYAGSAAAQASQQGAEGTTGQPAPALAADVEMHEESTASREMESAAQTYQEGQVGDKRKVESSQVDQASAGTPVDERGSVSEPHAEGSVKKGKLDDKPPARDRENCSVLIAGMPEDVTKEEIRNFFRDCGRIVEISGPKVVTWSRALDEEGGQSAAAAVVEFGDRSAIPAARTRDLKLIRDRQVSVNIGWESTLYVTNFPEGWEDGSVRDAFGRFGAIFDVRWPSRKFVSTRRFCYVQFTLPESAQAALSLGGTRVTETNVLEVAISDPSRRKVRSDAHANEKELYVAGLPRFVGEADLRERFERFGKVTGVRMPAKGIAFIDFERALDAQMAMKETNGTKFKGRVMAVTLALPKGVHGAVGGGKKAPGSSDDAAKAAAAADRRERSVRLSGLPDDAQEALIQQCVEQLLGSGSVKRVYWTPGRDSNGLAVVEFHNASNVGKALLVEGLSYSGSQPLSVHAMEEKVPIGAGAPERASRSSDSSLTKEEAEQRPSTLSGFAPRSLASGGRGRGRGGRGRGRVGVGFTARPSQLGNDSSQQPMEIDVQPPAPSNQEDIQPKGQDYFRDMLRRG